MCVRAGFTLPDSHSHRPVQREAEGFADGAVGFEVPGPDGVGGLLDGGAAGVQDVDEAIPVEAGEFLLQGFDEEKSPSDGRKNRRGVKK